jgi:hypothetical protein
MSETDIAVFTVDDLAAFKKRAAAVRKKHDLSVTAFRSWAGEILGRTVPKLDTLSKAEWEQMLVEMESKEGSPPQPNVFRFNLNDWRRAATLPQDFVPPSDAAIELVVDPSYTAKGHSDCSGLVVGFADSYRAEDGFNQWILLHAASDRWPGIKLAEVIVETAEHWKVKHIRVEYTSNGACDLLVANIKCRTQIPVSTFEPNKKKHAKAHRIMNLQTLLDATTPLPQIRFSYYAPFLNALFEQVENFLYESNKGRDRNREDGILDALAIFIFGSK